MIDTITTEKRGHLLLIGLDRAAKRNAFDLHMLAQFAAAYAELERDANLRCAVVFAHGDHFTGGLDLANVAPAMQEGRVGLGGDGVDPWSIYGKARTKPVVVAVQGLCLTLGIELCLASDITVASETARFAQIEIKRGIFPFGGATFRFVQAAGWGNAMRWLLTGDEFGAAEAHRIGLVQEVTPKGGELARAIAIAETIAAQAPLGVYATLASARRGLNEEAAAKALMPELRGLMTSDDAREGMMSFIERRPAVFTGK
jgi:enoyl-CoA hydratase